MLQNVLEDYLDGLENERQFDAPFNSLLPSLGFFDVHFTHGSAEFGKDFIAKKSEGNIVVQFSFQSKRGNIGQQEWREIQNQMLEAITSGLVHPNFDTTLPHQCILVTTGRLVGNAGIGLQDFNKNTVVGRLQLRPILCWDRQHLIQEIAEHGLDGVHKSTSEGFESYGTFFSMYGKALVSPLAIKDVEKYSRFWYQSNPSLNGQILCSLVESQILANAQAKNGFLYEAIIIQIAGLRAVMVELQRNPSNVWLISIVKQINGTLDRNVMKYANEARTLWESSTHGMIELNRGIGVFASYPSSCMRVMEIVALRCLFGHGNNSQDLTFLKEFVSKEQGCNHPISDRYAISLILAVLALRKHSSNDLAKSLLQKATVWVCDRYEKGEGLASVEADIETEISILLEYPFDTFKSGAGGCSFLATAICDLACFVQDERLYRDIVNDFKSCNIVFRYWQSQDTEGQFKIEAEDVIQYPNVLFADALSEFDDFKYAEHIEHERSDFTLSRVVDESPYLMVCLLLRDRYFPALWSRIAR